MQTSKSTIQITDAQREQYREEGYFILERAFDPDQVAILLEECNHFIDLKHKEMDAAGTDVITISHRGKRYFLSNTYKQSQRMHNFIFGPVFQAICQATLGQDAVFFLDQFVVKAAEKGLHFGWHQDSGYINFDHEPYVTCWTPLVDVTEENGTVYLLPYSQLGIKTRVTHLKDPVLNDKVGYFGDNPGIPVNCPAGSVAVFSSVCFHRSGPNPTKHMRPVMLTQYSRAAIIDPVKQTQLGQAVPFLKDGQCVVKDFPAIQS